MLSLQSVQTWPMFSLAAAEGRAAAGRAEVYLPWPVQPPQQQQLSSASATGPPCAARSSPPN